jgi:hypothetical protein
MMNNSTSNERANFSFSSSTAALASSSELQWPALEMPESFSTFEARTWDAPLNARRFAAPLPARTRARAAVAVSFGRSATRGF